MNNDVTSPLVSTIMVIAIISILLCSMAFFSINITVTLLLLAGVWALDVLLKNMLRFDNATIFADLSFASFVFSLGRGLSLLNASVLDGIHFNYILRLAMITFILLLVWVGNLNISVYLTRIHSEKSKEKDLLYWFFWVISFTLAMISAGLVLAQDYELIITNLVRTK